ncbi:cysteine-rich protein 2-binding protein-like isoform X2 [Dysidea avara]|uniref:cysteine-rich protein 2-binding protein-like isoform X2 n=1 Tax=Dysidea avara TaxID=196820 RepID=UPI00331F50CF
MTKSSPPCLCGDKLFEFVCSFCSDDGHEHCQRMNLQWSQVVHLAVYHMMTEEEGRHGFFRWNDHICMFIKNNWSRLLPYRKKTGSWQSTVAGVLSQFSPSIFKSGTSLLNESGWWSLQQYQPPEPKWHNTKDGFDHLIPLDQEMLGTPRQEFPQRSSLTLNLLDQKEIESPFSSQSQEKVLLTKSNDLIGSSRNSKKSRVPSLVGMSSRQETILLQHLHKFPLALENSCKAKRLARKLSIRALKQSKGKPLFDLDKVVLKAMEDRLHSHDASRPRVDPEEAAVSERQQIAAYSRSLVLERLSSAKQSILCSALPASNSKFIDYLQGQSYSVKPIVSPFTSRILKPFIWKDYGCVPTRVKLHEELMEYHRQRLLEKQQKCEVTFTMDHDFCYFKQPVQYCYLQEHHIPVVNYLIQEHFWPGVDVTECTQYPDFTVVAMYGHLIIGCGFLTPDVKPCEAYISFLFVHPDFQRAGIATFMLYHLIQTCMGKDVTLHCSVDNHAVLLYQKFGFKVEEFCLDFYSKYYPVKHYLSKHAFFMRLKR